MPTLEATVWGPIQTQSQCALRVLKVLRWHVDHPNLCKMLLPGSLIFKVEVNSTLPKRTQGYAGFRRVFVFCSASNRIIASALPLIMSWYYLVLSIYVLFQVKLSNKYGHCAHVDCAPSFALGFIQNWTGPCTLWPRVPTRKTWQYPVSSNAWNKCSAQLHAWVTEYIYYLPLNVYKEYLNQVHVLCQYSSN